MATKLTLAGGVALITGAASGLGEETAYAFAEAGVKHIVFADIKEDGAKACSEASRKHARHPEYECTHVYVDVADEASVQNMVDTTVTKFGRIDYFVHSAGLGNLSGAMTQNLKTDVYAKTMSVNVTGTMLCNRAVSHAMAKQEPLMHEGRNGPRSLGRGSIVNVGSANSYIAVPGMLPYTTSKHAVIGLTRSAAIDNFSNLIRVNTVCPSWIDTPMNQASLARVPALAQMIKAYSPLHRVASPEEVADYIVFLCSPSASYINGTGLVIDAGLSVTAHPSL